MKNYLLTLVLFAFTAGQAQINSQVTNFRLCDDNTDGVATFDLTLKNAEILANLNSAEHTITFYETLADSQTPSSAIANPMSYSNSSNPQTIFVRVDNNITTQTQYTSFQLVVNLKPIAHPATLVFCDPTELPVYNLDDAVPQLFGNQPIGTVTFYDSPIGGNVIAGGTFAPTTSPPPVFYAVIVSPITGCISNHTSITLTTCTTPDCPPVTGLSATNISSTAVALSWTGTPNTSNYWGIYITTLGAPAPVANTQITAYSQSNPFTYTGLVPDTCYTFYVKSFCSPGTTLGAWSEPYSFCVYNCENNGQCPESLVLNAFLDSNNNGIMDSGEVAFNSGTFEYQINDSGTLLHGNTNNGSYTIFESNPINSYNFNFVVNPELGPYYSASTTYINITAPAGSGSHTYYFPVTQLQPYNDLEILITPYGAPPRPGFTYMNSIRYKNKGVSMVASGTITFTNDPAVSIFSVSESGTVSQANGFSYTFSNLAPGEQRYFQVVMQVPTIPTVHLGDVITNSVAIEPLIDDAFPLNNSASLSQIIVGSYDPNDKAEAHGGKIALDTFTSNDYLTYTIQFENTGSANAEFIRVEDLLDVQLDPESVIMLNASHPYNMRRIVNKLIWNFYEVNLPPTMTNPSLSHGYIQFKIKPKTGYAVGTVIPNAADIYFDYNPAIVTDPFETLFVETLATNTFVSNGFYMYPNPSKTLVHLGLKNTSEKISRISICDVLGKSVKQIDGNQSNETTIDVSRFSKGIYFIEITTESNLKMTKKLFIN